jgi:transketolase
MSLILDDSSLLQLEKTAAELRLSMVNMLQTAGGGHYGGGLSSIDILTVLYFHVLRIDPTNPRWKERDRFVLCKGHANCAYSPTLAKRGFFSAELLNTYGQLDSHFGMHPDMNKIPGCDMSTGSIGHGTPAGVGMALAARTLKKDYRVYVLLGDGSLMEGSTWEAALIAAQYRLDNLCVIVDRNRFTCDGPTDGAGDTQDCYGIRGTLSLEPLEDKWRAFGWNALRCDGHKVDQLAQAFQQAAQMKGKPTAIIADTVKGKGLPFLENKGEYHYTHLHDDPYRQAVVLLEEQIAALQQRIDAGGAQ